MVEANGTNFKYIIKTVEDESNSIKISQYKQLSIMK